jgi:hypothetical protein
MADPNAKYEAELREQLAEAIDYVAKSALALEEAKGHLERDLDRLEKIKRKLDGLAALKAREDAYWAEVDAKEGA